jgi:hypothetical protein
MNAWVPIVAKSAKWYVLFPCFIVGRSCYCQSSHNLLVCVSQLLRCYDTRFRATQRKPDLYTAKDDQGESVIFPREAVADTVLSIVDGNAAATEDLEFGGTTDKKAVNVFWQCRTNLLVIATPYREGTHVATKPSDFVPIIDHLQYLHSKNYVHGDIRCFNMILALNPKPKPEPNAIFDASDGCLIDFDFGGKHDTAKYPIGYKQILFDGSRRGWDNAVIEKSDDWYALGMIIFSCYHFVAPTTIELDNKTKVALWLFTNSKFTGLETEITRLRQFLIDTTKAGYTMEKAGSFAVYMNKSGHDASTHMATGSPPNKGQK